MEAKDCPAFNHIVVTFSEIMKTIITQISLYFRCFLNSLNITFLTISQCTGTSLSGLAQ